VHRPHLPAGYVDGVGSRFGPRTGSPGVANVSTESASAGIVDKQTDMHRFAEPHGAVVDAAVLQAGRAGRQTHIGDHPDGKRSQQYRESACRPRR
jgi:hypothetical protein